MECRRSRSPCRTTRSPRLSPTSAPHGAIGGRRSAPAMPTLCAQLHLIEGPMLNSPPPPSGAVEPRDADIEAIVESGPRGAIAVAGIATFLVVAIWFAFYLFVFTPRAMTP